MVIEGIAYWASITSPNTTFEPTYTINLVISESKADELRSQGIKVVDKDEGPTVVIKRKVNGPNGMIRKAPGLIDNRKQEIDVTVGNGSHVKVQYKEWESQWNGRTYKGLDFMKMQVLKLVEYNDPNADEFEIEDEEEAEL